MTQDQEFCNMGQRVNMTGMIVFAVVVVAAVAALLCLALRRLVF
jgi:hypothetical protein